MNATLRRAGLASAWMLGALLLAGCGPGVGGTGTGAAAFAAFGASAAPVCGGAVAAVLACPSAPAVSAPPGAGTSPVQFADAAAQIVLELNGNVARLDDSCLKLHFSGEFGTVAGGAQGFFGSFEIDADGIDQLAALSTVPAAGGALTVELKRVDGSAAVGPVLLQRLSVPLAGPSPC
jgi:hypothetical protein